MCTIIRCFSILIGAAIFFICVSFSSAANLSVQGFITDWWVCGPFPSPGLRPDTKGFEIDYLKPEGGESSFAGPTNYVYSSPTVKVGDSMKAASWKKIEVAPEVQPYLSKTDITAILAEGSGVKIIDGIVAYAYCEINSEVSQNALLKIGSDDGFKVWLNGDLLASEHVFRNAEADQNTLPINLKKGTNRLLFKIESDQGGMALLARLTDKEGSTLKNISIKLPEKK